MARKWETLTVVCAAALLGSPAWGADDDAYSINSTRRALVSSAAPAAVAGRGDVELIQERYPNGAIKVEREVTQDAQGNYIHHGRWIYQSEQGAVIGQGQYVHGQRHGDWTRQYSGSESNLFSQQPYRAFEAPFISTAKFDNGQMNGAWTIHDAKQRLISEIQFTDGERDGRAVWYFPNGQKAREITFNKGIVDGEWIDWSADGKEISRRAFDDGRRQEAKVSQHSNGNKKQEVIYLLARVVVDKPDQWWNATLATLTTQGKDEKHGRALTYYPNSQLEEEREYDHDLPVGRFVRFYQNGQKQTEGVYENGEQIGVWTWWHQNGQKQTQGQYVDGMPSGVWSWWKEDGRIVQRANMSHGAERTVTTPGQRLETTKTPPALHPAFVR